MELKKQDVYLPVKVEGDHQPLQIKIDNEWCYLKPLKQVYVLTNIPDRRDLYEKFMNTKQFSGLSPVTKESIFNWFEKQVNQ